MRLIDTHCHLQSERFDGDRVRLVSEARRRGVASGLIAGGSPSDWTDCARLARSFGWAAGFGVHPLAVPQTPEEALAELRAALGREKADPASPVIAVAEIGLDLYGERANFERDEYFFAEQLRIARDFALPVSVHARRAADQVAKWLRRIEVPGGVIHAFNGSKEQAEAFLRLGFRLGFGGAMTYAGSLRIRRLAASLPLSSIVLETDCPDMPSSARRDAGRLRTEPADLAGYLEVLAELRGVPAQELAGQLFENALDSFPGFRSILERQERTAGRLELHC
ncbi:TatD family hydrolase [Mesosutterella sp. OilRF-GAM-744-9]|uniref:TatD family hydrolase n=1 Tax=Mesosutterella porci TaxID=2915351 RepID=A0ABS9MSY0_9BURK|nr:TatD family hydrolase [Mesosutterella sp. oilRF-744-WT-GAM-9]MCG5031719.1 TatD family hydrolase [Mesosutterella sp. oilRF-744-WT-GAM-9]